MDFLNFFRRPALLSYKALSHRKHACTFLDWRNSVLKFINSVRSQALNSYKQLFYRKHMYFLSLEKLSTEFS